MPSQKILFIFVLGVAVMRAAGCVINDIADRNIDGHVKRTQQRPLAAGTVTTVEAAVLFMLLCFLAFYLVSKTNLLTIKLSFGAIALAFCYPFMKRHTHLPQVVLGAAFAWGIPMAYAAQLNHIDQNIWLVYITVVIWTVVYDTFYAMVDRDDDIKVGVKSTAVLFGENDRLLTGILQGLTLMGLILIGQNFELGRHYYLCLPLVFILFIYQQWLIRHRQRQACFKAFLNNNWVGMVVFMGLVLNYLSTDAVDQFIRFVINLKQIQY